MRITNSMIYGNGLNNIWRNVRHVNQLVQQIETRKLIQRPSDDPIRAARSLRYRTTLGENQQFLANASSAMSWMETTEAAFMNLLTGGDSILQRMNTLFVAAADGVHSLDDRLGQVTELRELFDQIALEMNQTYMGRYVFSGFFTQHPPVLNVDWPGRSFVITQTVDSSQIQQVRSFQNFPDQPGQLPQAHNINVIKLPYRNIDFHFDTTSAPNTVPETGIFLNDGPPRTQVFVVDFNSSHPDAYRPPETMTIGSLMGLDPSDPAYDTTETIHFVHHVRDTGELVMSDAMRDAFGNGVEMTYEIRNLQAGELNPIVYFPSVEFVDNTPADIVFVLDGTNTMASALVPMRDAIIAFMNEMPANSNVSIILYGADPTYWRMPTVGLSSDVAYLTTWLNNNIPVPTTITGGNLVESGFEAMYQAMDLLTGSQANTRHIIKMTEAKSRTNDPAAPPLGNANIAAPGVHTLEGIINRLVDNDITFHSIIPGGVTIHPEAITQGQAMANATGGVAFPPGINITGDELTSFFTGLLFDVRQYDASDHYIMKEISPANHIPVNSLAPRAFTPAMYADLRGLFEFVESIRPSERVVVEQYFMDQGYTRPSTALDTAVNNFLSTEESIIKDALATRFSLMLNQFSMHTDVVQREHTHLGSRMNRVEMLQVRLEEEEINFTSLLSANEDTPLQDAIMRKNMAEAAFQAALRANAMIVQLSLVNFLR